MNDSTPVTSPAARRPWLQTIALVLVAVLAVVPVLDRRAAVNYEELFQRAIVTFALARTLNGVISAVQGTEVALQPAGVGVTLTPGEILDPVNDLVERFSWIMLGATVSLGVQSVLLEISAWWALQGVVVVLALWLGVLLWRDGPSPGRSNRARQILWRSLLVVLFLRFAVPLTLVANEAIYDLFLESRYTESTEIIQAAGNEIEAISEAAVTEVEPETMEEGMLDSLLGPLRDAWNEASAGAGLAERVAAIQARAGALIEHIIQLSVVFVLQTGLLPLAFLWLFLQLARWLLRPMRSEE
ncbi:MAG: hypothetical protein V2I57_15225 [Xanthomonadales bacterium]|jgi:hypothetical protein|nr:hypothetical protein [Xanthomonadales bacterium]